MGLEPRGMKVDPDVILYGYQGGGGPSEHKQAQMRAIEREKLEAEGRCGCWRCEALRDLTRRVAALEDAAR